MLILLGTLLGEGRLLSHKEHSCLVIRDLTRRNQEEEEQ